jgi:hypothetical protein
VNANRDYKECQPREPFQPRIHNFDTEKVFESSSLDNVLWLSSMLHKLFVNWVCFEIISSRPKIQTNFLRRYLEPFFWQCRDLDIKISFRQISNIYFYSLSKLVDRVINTYPDLIIEGWDTKKKGDQSIGQKRAFN